MFILWPSILSLNNLKLHKNETGKICIWLNFQSWVSVNGLMNNSALSGRLYMRQSTPLDDNYIEDVLYHSLPI